MAHDLPWRGIGSAPLYETAQNSLYLAAAQIRDQTNLNAGLPRMASLLDRYRDAEAGYHAELAQGYRAASDLTHAVRLFEEAARREPTAFR